jgi:uncharacterized radical SAM protein YgiQ
MFLPTTKEEMKKLGWTQCDVIMVTGDAYIDSPYIGVSVIGHVLMEAGYKVGIIAQPGLAVSKPTTQDSSEGAGTGSRVLGHGTDSIARLGEPRLFWGVSGGCVDSMVSNYTAIKKPRRSDDFTPGGENTKRPNRAVIAYSNLIRSQFKNTVPIILGGIEASLRRMAHYDYWQDGIRKSILFDAKADYLVYGMGERAVVEIAGVLEAKSQEPKVEQDAGSSLLLASGSWLKDIKGICYISKTPVEGCLELPSFDEVIKDKVKFIESFKLFYDNNDPGTSKGLMQKQDTRYLIQNPPAELLTTPELDKVYEFPYEYNAHPYYSEMGKIKALDTIRFSINSHRGCFGECNFCAITTHQGRIVTSRSEVSMIREAEKITRLHGFTGNIYDVGGPTANMYRMGCEKIKNGHCKNKRCIFPDVCPSLHDSHKEQMDLFSRLRQIKGIKKIFIGSGLRYDMIMADRKYGEEYTEMIVKHHISGQIKLAPEHSDPKVLKLMGKPGTGSLRDFKERYYIINKENGLKQFLTYYLIAAHPGCGEREMSNLKEYLTRELQANPEQVQVFTPTPGTWSGVMYYTETDPFTGEHVFVEKGQKGKERQKEIITGHKDNSGYKHRKAR